MPTLARRSQPRLLLRISAFALMLLPPAFGTTIVVDTIADLEGTDGFCSFREALVAADNDAAQFDCPAGSGADRIEFAVTGTIEIASDLPVFGGSLDIVGPGATELVLQGNHHRMLHLDGDPNGQTLSVSGLVLREGLHDEPGGCLSVADEDHLLLTDARILLCQSAESGGGVAGTRAASLRIVRSRIANNVAVAGGGGIALVGIFVSREDDLVSELRIEGSTVAGNSVVEEDVGGGIGVLFTRLTVLRSTVSGNETEYLGGGIFAGAAEVEVESSTVVENEAPPGAVRVGRGTWILRRRPLCRDVPGARPADDRFDPQQPVRRELLGRRPERPGDGRGLDHLLPGLEFRFDQQRNVRAVSGGRAERGRGLGGDARRSAPARPRAARQQRRTDLHAHAAAGFDRHRPRQLSRRATRPARLRRRRVGFPRRATPRWPRTPTTVATSARSRREAYSCHSSCSRTASRPAPNDGRMSKGSCRHRRPRPRANAGRVPGDR